MRVLFLDIDGVLNSTRTCVAFGGYPMELHHLEAFDQAAIALIKRLCETADVKIILSSAWRLHHPFADVGKALALPIVGRTPSLAGPRGMEINAWLTSHPEATEYAIVDDDPDMLPDQLVRFVRTDGHEGLTWRDFVRLCSLFGTSPHAGGPRDRHWRTGEKLDWS